jgi:anti-sigma B factor antagonist
MDASMRVTKPKTAGGVCVVELSGEIDVFASPSVKATLLDLIKDGYRLLAIDFARVAYIDSTGLGALIAALKKAREQGGSVAIVCTNQQIRRIFEITGLAKAFAMFDSVGQAVEALGTSPSPAAT